MKRTRSSLQAWLAVALLASALAVACGGVDSGGTGLTADTASTGPISGYDAEVRHFLEAISKGSTNADLTATIEDAARTAALPEAELRALQTRTPQRVG